MTVDLLDLVLHYDCNLKCTYCTITDDMRARRGLSLDDVAREMARAAAADCRSLQITGGEPTMRSDLLKMVRFAVSQGFESIKVQTNGLLFANSANLERALNAGVTRVAVSVHGWAPTGREYADVTQGGSEASERMIEAVANLVAADVELEVDMIVMASTLADLPRSVAGLHALGVERFNLWFVSLTDQNAANIESMPRLTDAVPAVKACLEYGLRAGVAVTSLHIPRCLLPGHVSQVRHPGVGEAVRVVTPDAVFDLSRSRLSGGHKPERCGRCVYFERCPGLRADYVARFGDGELVPITE